ncbi:MAG: TetR/AcrR family transcriptional regulator [Bacteroidota bacterium]
MKKEILQKSLEFFLKHGIREMSNDKLVELLGISTKTLYKHFANKEELLEEVLYLYHNMQYEKLQNLPIDQNAACVFFDVWQLAVETEYKVNKVFYDDLSYYYPRLEKKVEKTIGKKFEKFFLSIIQRGIEEGSFRKEIPPRVALQSVFVLHRMAVRNERFKKFRLSANDLLLDTTAVYIRGLCTDEGIHALDKHIKRRQSAKFYIKHKQ